MTLRNTHSKNVTAVHPTYKKTTLENGIRVISEEIPTVKSASIGVWINTGSQNETETTNGISHFIEHMLFKGTKKRNYLQIAQSVESVGGYLNAFTTKEHTCYYARVLDEYVGHAVDILSDMVQYSTFPVKEIEKEKTVILEEIKRSEDDPDDLIHEYFDRHLFGDNPYARPIIGTAENIRRFTRDELVRYTDRMYTNGNIVLAAAGNVTHDQIVRLAEKFFVLKRNHGGKKQKRAVPRNARVIREYVKPIQQAHLLTGTVAFNAHHPMRYPGMVMNSVLGDGMSSRLFQNIREKHGLAYSVYSFLSMAKETGAFGVYVGTDRRSVQKATDLAYAELERIKTVPLKRSELHRAKAQLKGNMLMSLESTSNRMMRLGNGELYFGEYRTLDSIVKNIDAVTAEDVQRAAQKLFNIDAFTTVVLLPQHSDASQQQINS